MSCTHENVDPLIQGFKKFREQYFENEPELYRDELSHAQHPRFAVVACSDSRVDPAIVHQTSPGEIFTVRNVAALVPPCDKGAMHHGVSSALEFAVNGLGVEHIIIIGHAHCGGVAAMVRNQEKGEESGEFITPWTDQLSAAHKRALDDDPTLSGDDLLRASERYSVNLSLENLETFPFICDAVQAGRLRLHGWYFDFTDGVLETWNSDTAKFELV